MCTMLKLLVLAIYLLKLADAAPEPFDFLDDAQALLDNFQLSVLGEIRAAHLTLDNSAQTSMVYGNNSYFLGQATLSAYSTDFRKRVDMARQLIGRLQVDKSYCLKDEAKLYELLTDSYTSLQGCVLENHDEVTSTVDSAKYYVDVQYNKVVEIQFNLDKCTSADLLCISSVVSDINANSIELVQNIAVQEQKTLELVDILKLTYNLCREVGVSQYSANAQLIINGIFACIEE